MSIQIKHNGITYPLHRLNSGDWKVNGVIFKTLEHFINTVTETSEEAPVERYFVRMDS
ncbi:hypothetical protein AB4452_04635 [Vibrio lentus]